jgi:hypothetical protein
MPTAETHRRAFERVNEGADEEEQRAGDKFLMFYELRTGRLF